MTEATNGGSTRIRDNVGLYGTLSTMMLLQYAIWGAWLPLLYPFLLGYRGFSFDQVGNIFMAGAVGAIAGPFIAGQFADRYFNTERFLAASHLIGAGLVWYLATTDEYVSFLVISALYGLVYAPTLALTNSLAFHHMPDRDKWFGWVRVFGTIGWIIASICVAQWLAASWTPDAQEPAEGFTVQAINADPHVVAPLAVDQNPDQLEGVLTVEMVESTKATVVEELLKDRGLEAPRMPDGKTLDYAPAVTALGLSPIDLDAKQVEALSKAIVKKAQSKGMGDAFKLSAFLGFLMAFFCLFLPKTPPSRDAAESAWIKALAAAGRQPLITLFILAVPISCIHQFYFVHTSSFLGDFQRNAGGTGLSNFFTKIVGVGGGGLMTIGQMTEIGVLALIPVFAKKLSRKNLLAIGILAYAGRMALFAYADSLPLILLGVALHGLCFGCFIFVAFMIVDEETTIDIRASAQNLFNLVIIGIGIIVGSKIATWIGEWSKVGDNTDYSMLFAWPMWGSVACLMILLAVYPNRRPAAA